MSVLLLPPIFQFFDNNGDPLANGFVDTFAAGTTTRLATYTDSTGTIAAPNPIELDPAGRPTSGSGAIWGQGAYKFIVRDANGVQVGATLDNVISFNSLAAATNAYAETFSGNGVQTVFTASSDLGTDPKALLISTASGLQNIIANGDFATDTIWTKGAGWTIAAGVATATGAISTAISQVPIITVIPGQAYAVTYTITASAGSLTPSIGGQAGTARTVSGTYREIIIAAATTPVAFTGAGFTGTLDNVTITVATNQNMTLLPANSYTVNGTSITFASPPALGVNNIDVRAPSLLLGAASSAAALAQLYAANALTSQTAAAASAALAATVVKWKPAVACATTANITLSGEQTIDTVLTSGSRVLVKDQTNATQNGVYVSAAGAWARATDADTWTEIQGQAVYTSGGSANIQKSWVNTNETGGTIGVDNITWTQLQAFGDMSKNVYDPANINQQMVGLTAAQTVTNKDITVIASTTGTAGLTVPHGVAPTSPANGDIWTTTTGAFARINGTTKQLDSSLTYGAPVLTTSGTEVNYLGLPTGIKQIDILFSGVSFAGTADLIILIGQAGSGFTSTGYTGGSTRLTASAVTVNSTANFLISMPASATASMSGRVTLQLLDEATFKWTASGILANSATAQLTVLSGALTLGAVLDKVRITSSTALDTFDTGTINIVYQ